MLDIAEVGLDYDLPALLGGRLHFPVGLLDFNEMVVVKNQDGALNVDALKVAEGNKPEAKPEKAVEAAFFEDRCASVECQQGHL